jgi:hypothetical protein
MLKNNYEVNNKMFILIEEENRQKLIQIIKKDKIEYPNMKYFVNKAIAEKIRREYAFTQDETTQLIRRIIRQ